ncbi:hypothetical protein KA119_02335 [Candidatus Gracilibacteria bacterium]|nr:hypothetical protein [Candidatus Gracilibacteria bacterium]
MSTAHTHISPAKINLSLDILGKTASGFHKIQTIFHATTQIHDLVNIRETDQDDSLSISQAPQKSPIHVLKLLRQHFRITQNFHIEIKKNIPHSSGLGGTSSNNATILKALNQILNLQISQSDLFALAAQLGMDTPFFILDCQNALGENFGEQLTPLPDLPLHTLKINPVSSPLTNKTAENYSKLDLTLCALKTAKTDLLLRALQNGDLLQIIANLHNDFEQLYPDLPKNHHLSGSGPSEFILTP